MSSLRIISRDLHGSHFVLDVTLVWKMLNMCVPQVFKFSTFQQRNMIVSLNVKWISHFYYYFPLEFLGTWIKRLPH